MSDADVSRHPDCHCRRAVHAHGQYATYIVHRCRCDDCRTANRDKERWRRRAKAYGRYDRLVDAAPVRAHIRSLMAAGMGLKTIASAGGWRGSGTIGAIVYGKWADQPDHPEHRPPRKQVTRDVADRVLAIQPELRPGARTDARGTTRRLQALVARGYSLVRIADRLGGIERLAVYRLAHGNSLRCLESTRAAVAALYDELADTPPVSVTGYDRGSIIRAQRFAARHGWVVAAAWDDIDLDDTPSLGDTPQAGRTKVGRIHPDDIAWMLRTEHTSWAAAERLGVTRGYLLELAQRHGIDIPAHIRVGDEERAQMRREGKAA